MQHTGESTAKSVSCINLKKVLRLVSSGYNNSKAFCIRHRRLPEMHSCQWANYANYTLQGKGTRHITTWGLIFVYYCVISSYRKPTHFVPHCIYQDANNFSVTNATAHWVHTVHTVAHSTHSSRKKSLCWWVSPRLGEVARYIGIKAKKN